MTIFNDKYKDQLHIAWRKFINNEEYDYSFIRPEIYASWLRSRAYSVDPNKVKTSILEGEALNTHINANISLIDVVHSYMERLYSFVKGSGFYLLLSDKDGYIIDLLGDRDIIEDGRKNSLLVVGANRSEEFAGTNAIGTCLFMKAPVQIWNEEHYISGHKKYACSSAPLYGAEGELLGCLNLTGRYTDLHPHTLGMVLSAADGISKELTIKNAYNKIETISDQRNSIIESMPSGLILLNMQDRIIQINNKALKILGIEYNNAIGKSIFSLASFDEFSKEGLSFSGIIKKIYNKETNILLTDSNSLPKKYNMNINLVGNDQSNRSGTLIMLDETKLINRLVNKISGFKSVYTFDSITGESAAMNRMIDIAVHAAKGDSTVLILGESGTGKELIAQSIHNASSHSNGPFVAINCGALPLGLIESELFGYERGAFTGASIDGNPGKFELADEGTIFLDEIGDMPLSVQASLLRVLQNKEIVRIGSKSPKKINVRIIAATNKDLASSIESKTFREDLYYRLNVLTINVPALRDRVTDIPLLINYFIKNHNISSGENISIKSELLPLLKAYPWYGNVRELENAIERALSLTTDGIIKLEDLPPSITDFFKSQKYISDQEYSEPLNAYPSSDNQATLRIDDANKQLIISSLFQTDGNIKAAAELLGISRRTLYRKLEKYNLNSSNYR